MAEAVAVWPFEVRLGAVQRSPTNMRLVPDEAVRKALARQLGLVSLDRLEADIALASWMDGAELSGWIKATVVQTCSITAEPLESEIDAGFSVRLVPEGSANIPQLEGVEIEIDAEADDAPDVLESEVIDVSQYVVEHLSLELDPFPRKPGAVFEPPVDPTPLSPFAALAALRDRKPSEGEGD
jgi:hypothetical protein